MLINTRIKKVIGNSMIYNIAIEKIAISKKEKLELPLTITTYVILVLIMSRSVESFKMAVSSIKY